MKIGICNDHRGVNKKNRIIELLNNYEVINYGTDSEESVDFPDYAFKLGDAINNGEVDLGIAICGTGIGMSITLNKMKGIYCAKVSNVSEATLSRAHNDANVIALSEELPEEEMLQIVQRFIETPFSNCFKIFSGVGKFSGIIPPFLAITSLIFFPIV